MTITKDRLQIAKKKDKRSSCQENQSEETMDSVLIPTIWQKRKTCLNSVMNRCTMNMVEITHNAVIQMPTASHKDIYFSWA